MRRLQQLHALADEPAVRLELRLAGAAQADAAFLPLEVGPAAREPRGQVRELRELDLQLAFRASCAQREDVEDEARAIDDAAGELLFEIALLHAGERVIEDDEVGVRLLPPGVDLVDLALACEVRRIGPRSAAGDEADHDGARGHREVADLALAIRAVVAAEVECDQQRAVAAARTLKHQLSGSVDS